jgi:hypothetical protein
MRVYLLQKIGTANTLHKDLAAYNTRSTREMVPNNSAEKVPFNSASYKSLGLSFFKDGFTGFPKPSSISVRSVIALDGHGSSLL